MALLLVYVLSQADTASQHYSYQYHYHYHIARAYTRRLIGLPKAADNSCQRRNAAGQIYRRLYERAVIYKRGGCGLQYTLRLGELAGG